jgi:hypothetical protein
MAGGPARCSPRPPKSWPDEVTVSRQDGRGKWHMPVHKPKSVALRFANSEDVAALIFDLMQVKTELEQEEAGYGEEEDEAA